ncbi:peptide deformylase [Aeromicrobium yanjiei]|uniref:Peptide deformylase n=1 Tax=Aeromicrobium yanjiei TaxID=2662028 RepID=A0A5Q2MHV4_9ACTN|nr:peptide deformylase [Aeromicrobium yanjiei]QGG41341.1 peptide deformylase [Aeromicrobium yanjiei]
MSSLASQSRPLPEGGSVLPITRWGTPVMHHELADVTVFDDELRTLVADMVATMYAARGVGLAANQVGVDLKVFVFDCPDGDDNIVRGVVCNPVLTLPEGKDRHLEDEDEGCLSLPGAFTSCARPDVAHVTGQDENGEPVEFHGTGLLARCLQHETDHLFGTVFGDRVPERARKKLYKQHQELADNYPDDWPVTILVDDDDED